MSNGNNYRSSDDNNSRGLYKTVVDMKLEEMMDEQLKLQVDLSFEIYKKGTERFYETYGLDGHIGSKLSSLLEAAGYESIVSELDCMSNKDIGIRDYQLFMLHEARLFHEYDPNSLSKHDLDAIGQFVEEVVPSPDYYGTYGVVMITATSCQL